MTDVVVVEESSNFSCIGKLALTLELAVKQNKKRDCDLHTYKLEI
jgi:hypothetical protein